MAEFFPLQQLPVSLLVRVLQKMTPVSFARLRRSCKAMGTVAEKHRRHIGIILYKIDLFWSAKFDNNEVGKYLYTCADKFIVTIWTKNRGIQIRMTLAEAKQKLSGYSFDKVHAISRTMRPALSCMAPDVRSEFMDFMKHQRWSVRAAACGQASKELLGIIKPRVLKTFDDCFTDIPKSVKTLEIGDLEPGSAKWINFKDVPSHIEDYLIYPRSSVEDEHFMPAVIRKIAQAFYDDELSVGFVHLKRFNFLKEMLPKIDIPAENQAGAAVLSRFLIGTPYENNSIVTFDEILTRFPEQAASEPCVSGIFKFIENNHFTIYKRRTWY